MASRRSTAQEVRARIERGGDRLWRIDDCADLSAGAVAQALSRLAREGVVDRVAKGVYHRPRETVIGPSVPTRAGVAAAATGLSIHPTGLAAANLLGFTTQNPATMQVTVTSAGVPRSLGGARVTTRRPASYARMSSPDAALLEFLRVRGASSDLDPEATVDRLLLLLARDDTWSRLVRVASDEPPRVRAILGAAGQQLGMPDRSLRVLSASLNPLSRFEFGVLRGLVHAKEWQAK